MSKRWTLALVGLVCFLAGTVVTQNLPLAFGQAAPKPPVWKHGLDLKARKGGETEFKEARKFGVEVFLDENNGNLVYISETGSIAVVPGK